ncbi:MAG: hypothetical protein MJZ59_04640 [Paludibacteraceae bacterium]|nr:hypothetical protein [Paludibacteraceae bacterium]
MDKLESTQQEQAEQLRAVMSGVDTILTELESRRDSSRPNPIGYEAIAKRDKE